MVSNERKRHSVHHDPIYLLSMDRTMTFWQTIRRRAEACHCWSSSMQRSNFSTLGGGKSKYFRAGFDNIDGTFISHLDRTNGVRRTAANKRIRNGTAATEGYCIFRKLLIKLDNLYTVIQRTRWKCWRLKFPPADPFVAAKPIPTLELINSFLVGVCDFCSPSRSAAKLIHPREPCPCPSTHSFQLDGD